MRIGQKILAVLPIGAALVLGGVASSALAQVVTTTVDWTAGSCPNQMYQMVGGTPQILTVINPRTMKWDTYANAPTGYNGYAYVPSLGKAYATRGASQTVGDVWIGLVDDTGNVVDLTTPRTFTTVAPDSGAAATGGYDEVNDFFWSARAVAPNVLHVFDQKAPPSATNPQTVTFAMTGGADSPSSSAKTYPQIANPAIAGDVTGADGAAQFTDVVVVGNKVYAVAMNSLFIYEFAMSGRTITPVSTKRIRLDTIVGNSFPYVGTFGAVWTALSPQGKPVIYASLNTNNFTNGTAGVYQAWATTPSTPNPNPANTVYPAGSLFRIENIDTAAPVAGLETFKSNVAQGGDGYNCSKANALWLLEVADDVNYTPINTPVSGSWIANDNLYAAKLTVPPPNSATTKGGTITVKADGTYDYTPATGFTGTDTFVYEVCDNFAGGGTECRTATITIYVAGPAGVGQDDSGKTPLNTPITLNVLANDVFPKPANPVITTTPPANGSVVVNAGGNITYTPTTGFTGVDTYTYTTTDSNGTPHTQTVTVVVGPLGAVPDRYTTSAGTPFTTTAVSTSPATSTALTDLSAPAANDVYPQGATFAITTPVPGGQGVVTGFDPATSTFTYDPQGFTGTTTFTYQVCQPAPATPVCSPATVTIVVPGAVDDSYATQPNTPVSGAVAGNDATNVDPKGFVQTGPLSNPAAGAVVFNPDGTFVFTPTTGFSGTVTFPYKACLPRPDDTSCADALVTIVVPSATNDAYTTPSNTPVGGNVGTNDGMPTGSTFVTTGPLSNPAAGTFTLNPDGTFSFVPAPGYPGGTVTVPYQACLPSPNQATCAPAVVSITVAPPVAGAPKGVDDSSTTPMNTPVIIPILSNDTGNGLSVVSVTQPAQGTVVINNGTVTYTPPAGWSGTTTFTYTAKDQNGATYTNTVTVVVSPITAVNDSYVALPGATLTGNPAGNDTYPASSTFAATGPLSNPAAGTLGAMDPATGSFSFTPAAGFSGTVTFPYQVCQPGGAACANAVVTIVVPGAKDDSYTTPVNTTLNANVGTNDPVPAGSTFTSTGVLSNPAAGQLSFNADGSFSFVPAKDFVGTVSFPYTACLPAPNSAVCANATATINIGATAAAVPVNSPWALAGLVAAMLGWMAVAAQRRKMRITPQR